MLKKLWDWLWGGVKTLLDTILGTILEEAKRLTEDKDLVALALDAVKAAASEGLTGDKAWTVARDRFTAALKEAGRQLGDCAIDTTLQTVYSAWKNTHKKEA